MTPVQSHSKMAPMSKTQSSSAKTSSICLVEVSDGALMAVHTFARTRVGRAQGRRLFAQIAANQASLSEDGQFEFTPEQVAGGWREKRLMHEYDGLWSLHVVDSAK